MFKGGVLQQVITAVSILIFCAGGAEAKVKLLLDIDGTINNDYGPTAGWRTAWRLKRIDALHTALQPDPYGKIKTFYINSAGEKVPIEIEIPDSIDLSAGEVRYYLGKLGKGDAQIGDLQAYELPDDSSALRPRFFVPGYYMIAPDISFERYRPGVGGRNFLLEDYQASRQRVKASKNRLSWKGPAFPLFAAATHREETVANISGLTARFHFQEEFQAWFDAMAADGEINHSTGIDQQGRKSFIMVHALEDPKAVVYGKSIPEKKAQVLWEEALQLLRSSESMHWELAVDARDAAAGKLERKHTLIVAEDDPKNIEPLRRKLQALSSDNEFSHKIKFVLLNAGSEEDLQGSYWKWRWTVFDRGFAREALATEVEEWTDPNSKTWKSHLSAMVCSNLFANTKGAP